MMTNKIIWLLYIESAYINNLIDTEKNSCFSAVVGGKLTTSQFAPQILFCIYFACWLYLIPA